MSKNMSTIPAVDEYEKRRARGLAAVEEAMAANTQSNADRVIKDYQDAELARVVNSVKPEQKAAPVVDENVPIIDTTLEYEPPTEEMKKFEEEKTQAQWQKDYADSIWSKEDEEAAAKRQKAAQWITAAQMLGDSIAALGNSYFTAKGANAMKVDPGAQKAAAATSQLEQDIRNAREKAAKARYDATLKKYELEMEKNKADRAQADSDRKHEETVRHNKATEDISRLSAENAAKSANIAMYNAETSRLNAGTAARNASVNEAEEGRKAEQYNKQHGDRKFLIGDQWVNIPKDKWEGVVGSIYNSLPEEIRKVYETQVTDELGIKKETRKAPTIAVMDAAVRQYAQDPAVAEAILRAAGINPDGASAANTKAQTLDGTYVSAPIDATKNAGSMGGYGSAADWVSGVMDNVRKMSSGNGTMDIKDAENKWSGSVIKNKE